MAITKKMKKIADKELANKSIQIYVRAGVYDDVKVLADRTGLSVSALAWMAFSEGYPSVRDSLMKLKAGKKPNVSITSGN